VRSEAEERIFEKQWLIDKIERETMKVEFGRMFKMAQENVVSIRIERQKLSARCFKCGVKT
jgi:hypothetical protein